MNTILEAKFICKNFKDIQVLDHFDFTLNQGEVHAIIGENGSGKSTFVNILAGIYKPDGGHLYLDKNTVHFDNIIASQKAGIHVIFQNPYLYENKTIAENILIDRLPQKGKWGPLDKNEMIKRAKEMLTELKFSLNPAMYIWQLNYAEKRVVEITRALFSKKRIIIMDEALSSLTDLENISIFKKINKLKKEGASIIYISQRLQDIEKIADRITIIRNGRVTYNGMQKDISKKEIVNYIVGSGHVNRYPKIQIKKGATLLSVKNLSAQDGFIKNINFSIKHGEAIGFTGLIGSGKNELGPLIFNNTKLNSGDIEIENKSLNTNTPKNAIENGVAYLSNDRTDESVYSNLSVADNLTSITGKFGNRFFKTKHEDIRVASCLKLIRSNVSPHSKMYMLSGGNQQKIALSKWFFTNAMIFIINEPTMAIDVAAKSDIYNIFGDLLRNGAALILISSDVEELLGICDKLYLMDNGTIIKEFLCEKTQLNEINEYLYENQKKTIQPNSQ